jgi:hypothetical protein
MPRENVPRRTQSEQAGKLDSNPNPRTRASIDDVRRLLTQAGDLPDAPTEDEVNLWQRVFNDNDFGEAIFQGAALGKRTTPDIQDAIARLRESFAKSVRNSAYEANLFKELRSRRNDRHGKA